MTPTGFEPVLPPWKGGVLTTWPWSLFFSDRFTVSSLKHFSASPTSPSRARTSDSTVNSRVLYQLSYRGSFSDTFCTFKTSYKTLSHLFHLPSFGQSLDRLVTVSSMCCHTSTSALSTSSSSRGLTTLQYGKSYLWGGFTLRCLQRLSLPDLATLLCTWQYNRYTSGPSIPVLSY